MLHLPLNDCVSTNPHHSNRTTRNSATILSQNGHVLADITRVHPETDPICIHCSEEPQTVDHLLFSCPAFLRHRIQTAILLGLTQLNPKSMARLPGSTSAWNFLDNWFNSAIKTGRENRTRVENQWFRPSFHRPPGIQMAAFDHENVNKVIVIVESVYEKISPCKPLQNVIFNATLNEPTNKQYQNPEYLKQLSLEIINNIPKNAITIYTDGSRDELGHTGSGCLIKTTNGIEKMNRRNPDFCSVFRSELIAIYEALKSIRNTNYQDIWILTDSRSAIQHLSHTGELRDKVSRNIIGYLQKLSKTSKIHLQWIPSHVGIEGNEAADVLAKKGTKEPLPQKNKLTFKEIETIAKTKINKNWRIPPKHSWYSGVNPGGALKIRNRQHQTTLTRFRTGHLKPLKIENNNKIYPTCPKCSLVPAAPEHILACIRCTKQDLWERPLLIIKQLEEHELMEFVPGVFPDFGGFDTETYHGHTRIQTQQVHPARIPTMEGGVLQLAPRTIGQLGGVGVQEDDLLPHAAHHIDGMAGPASDDPQALLHCQSHLDTQRPLLQHGGLPRNICSQT
ncbi:hypothetical protein LAZ67_16002647 [Cordylochernes scorpioides]|uniref:RNase H type-1 domain-containing protein n=1 Tax=Cordylochernes scorpioides TaxID=51811 RepID=A0ABY6LC39_9ARAC|nr:hypothetical protein LAZ67_16002647 [Cordylochernes scorpioides]